MDMVDVLLYWYPKIRTQVNVSASNIAHIAIEWTFYHLQACHRLGKQL